MLWFYLGWNMTDKELLELAARAAGYKIKWLDMKGGYERFLSTPKLNGEFWNPLTDDGDALRLAVALRLLIDTDYNDCIAAGCCQLDEVLEPAGVDRLAATRRAIVRAAAAIGEKL